MNAPRKPTVSAIALVWLFALICARPVHAQAAEGCVSRPAGLVAWWPGDGHTFDVAGTNHARLQNHANYASGESGQALRFDGVSDHVAVPDKSLLSPQAGTNGEMTVMAWVQIPSPPSSTSQFLAKGARTVWANAL